VTADTNVLLRATLADDPDQTRRAQALLGKAELVAMPLVALCEFVWSPAGISPTVARNC
jgi:hypothetical protein